MIITLFVLGMWQLHRMEWKERHASQILNMDPHSFASMEEVMINLKKNPEVMFRKVRVKGVFLHELSIELISRTYHGQSGAHVYTPMVMTHSGYMVMVNRGWVPDKKDGIKYDNPVGEVELQGYLQSPPLPGWVTPDNVIEKKAWYYLDLEAMEDVVIKAKPELEDKVLPFYMISIEKRERDDFPKPIEVIDMVKNNHFGYALTWFFLAISLGIMYIFFVVRSRVI
jgi:surfeit locus 1 family protein